MKRKIISLLLCLVMALSLIPTVAFGDKGGSTPKLSPISITVTKEWDDDNNSLNKRPDSVTVKLLKDGEETGKTLTLYKDNWTGSFTDVPADGVYTVSEEPVDGYMPVYTQQPVITLRFSGWNEKITPANELSYSIPVGRNLIVANKGNAYYVWTLTALTDAQKNDLMLAVNKAKLEGLGTALEAGNTEFKSGIPATFNNGTKIENGTITFKKVKDWSLFYCGTVTLSSVTGAKITNTYEKDTPTLTGSLEIIKDFEGLPVGTTPDSVSFTVTGPNSYNQTVTMTANDQWTKTLTGLTPGEYTVTENEESAKVEGYVLTAQNAKTVTVSADKTAPATVNFINTYKEESTPPAEVSVEISVTKNVTISRGSKEPAETPFTFEAYVGNQKVGELKLTPTSAGKWTATDNLTVSIPYDLFKNDVATVTIKEVKGTDTRWKYDTKEYKVLVYEDGTYTANPEIAARATRAVQEPELTTLTFTNEYNYKYTPTPRPTTPAKPVTSVKTGDMGVALYAGLAILSMTGSAGVILRRRKNDK